jgi:hypothetical protein
LLKKYIRDKLWTIRPDLRLAKIPLLFY